MPLEKMPFQGRVCYRVYLEMGVKTQVQQQLWNKLEKFSKNSLSKCFWL